MNEYILPIILIAYFNLNLIFWIIGLIENIDFIKDKNTIIIILSTLCAMYVFIPFLIYNNLKNKINEMIQHE